MCDSGHDSLASDSSGSLSLATPSPPPLAPGPPNPMMVRPAALNPPNITPIGGVPNFSSSAGLVRPIAFRPAPVKDAPGPGAHRPGGQAGLKGPGIKDFAPGHPLHAKKGGKFYGSSQDLSRPSPGPPPSLSKYSSLDRRSLARRLGPGQPRLVAWEPVQPPEEQPPPKPRPGKEPERRHSSYNPSSSLTRTPSQNSEYRARVAQQRMERREQKEQQQQATNPIHVSGLPDPFRPVQPASGPSSPPGPGPRPGSVRSTEGRVRLSGAGTPQFPPLSVSRLSQSSLTNLASHPPSNPVKRTDSARRSQADNREAGEALREAHARLREGSDGEYQTPSPADSAVGDLEQVLREREGEIVYLRDTLEQNEQVIFRVYEEKEKTWEREIRKIKGLYETQLKTHQMKASKMEAALANQTYQVQSEKRKLELEVRQLGERAQRQAEENEALRSQVSFLRDQGPARAGDLGEDQAEVAGCREELRQAKEVIEDLMANRAALAGEVAGLKGLLSGLDDDFSLHEVKAQKAIIIERDRELEAVRQQLHGREEVHLALRREHDRQVEKFEVETANWLSEKEKVIRYQKQLQLNYVSMYKKNKTLEQEMEQLKASLAEGPDRTKSGGGHVSSAKAKLFSKFSSKFGD